MSWLERRLTQHPALVDWIEGAGMVFYAESPAPMDMSSPSKDFLALISDMAAVGGDIRSAMKRLDEYGTVGR